MHDARTMRNVVVVVVIISISINIIILGPPAESRRREN